MCRPNWSANITMSRHWEVRLKLGEIFSENTSKLIERKNKTELDQIFKFKVWGI